MTSKYINSPQLIDKLHDIFDMMDKLIKETGKTEYLETLLRYIVTTIDDDKIENLNKELKKSFRKKEDIMPNYS